jgi:SAM-dependent methyltransferase
MDIRDLADRLRTVNHGPVERASLAGAFRRISSANDLLTEYTRAIWSPGEYDRVAAGIRHEAEAFVARQELTPWQHVLDAACGSGNVTIPAARAGAQVSGIDLVPAMLAAARARAARENLWLMLDQGTVENLPYADDQFDVVLSMFGVMFAARPERVVSELARVTRPGGRVALANWTRRGFVGRVLATQATYVPPIGGVPNPLLWGDESVVRRRFDERDWFVTTTVRTLTLRYPYTPAGTAALFRKAHGPTISAFAALADDRRPLLAADLTSQWTRAQRSAAGMTEVDSEYLEVVATRR